MLENKQPWKEVFTVRCRYWKLWLKAVGVGSQPCKWAHALSYTMNKSLLNCLGITDMDVRLNKANVPLHVRVLRDDISLQCLNQVSVFSSSVELLHLRLRGLRFVLELDDREELQTFRTLLHYSEEKNKPTTAQLQDLYCYYNSLSCPCLLWWRKPVSQVGHSL